jgi:branched-chain amino acid transport system substrate-binding protein
MYKRGEIMLRINKLVAVIFVIILVVVGVGAYFLGQTSLPRPTASRLTGEIYIGFLHSSAMEEGADHPAYEMALEDINEWCEKSGIPVKFVGLFENAEESATKAAERVESLIARGVKIIIGPEWSGHVRALSKLVNDREIVLFSPSSSAPDLAIPNDYIFRMYPDDRNEGIIVSKLLKQLNFKAVIAVYGKEAYGEGVFKESIKNWENAGIETLLVLSVDPEKKEFVGEFASVAEKFKEACKKYNKDEVAIYLFSTHPVVVTMLTSLGKYPELLTARVFTADNAGAPGFIEYAGQICAKTQFTATNVASTRAPGYKEWRERYKAKTGYEPYYTGINGYDCTWIAALSILTAGEYSGPAIKAVLPRIAETYYGISGWCALNEAGDKRTLLYDIYQIVERDGAFKWVIIGLYDGAADVWTWHPPIEV